MANVVYNTFKGKIGDGTIDWDACTAKIALVTSAYSPDIDTHTKYSTHITNELPTGDGYTLGGATLANKSVTVDDTDDWAEYDADNVTWSSSTLTARGAVFYDSVTDDLICYLDFGADKSSENGNFTINFHADGVFKLA